MPFRKVRLVLRIDKLTGRIENGQIFKLTSDLPIEFYSVPSTTSGMRTLSPKAEEQGQRPHCISLCWVNHTMQSSLKTVGFSRYGLHVS